VDVPQTSAIDVFGRHPQDIFWSSRFYVVTTSVPDVIGTSASRLHDVLTTSNFLADRPILLMETKQDCGWIEELLQDNR